MLILNRNDEKHIISSLFGLLETPTNQGHYLLGLEVRDVKYLFELPQSLHTDKFITEIKQAKASKLHYVNSFPYKPWFLFVCSTNLLKTLWEKEKLLVTSNFSFSHSVFYPF